MKSMDQHLSVIRTLLDEAESRRILLWLESGWVIEYSRTHPGEQLHLFTQRRQQLVDFARSLALEAGTRFCQHERIGRISLEGLLLLIPLHDAYHLRQVTHWRCDYARKAQ